MGGGLVYLWYTCQVLTAGKVLGVGSKKVCYELGPCEVALVCDPQVLLQEKRWLDRLSLMGVPALKVRMAEVWVGSRFETALVCARYSGHCLTWESPESYRDAENLKGLLPRHVPILRHIMARFKANRVGVGDLQFMWNSTALVVADPSGIGRQFLKPNLVSIKSLVEVLTTKRRYSRVISPRSK